MTNSKDRVRTLLETVSNLSSYIPCADAANVLVTTPLRSCEFPIDRDDLTEIDTGLSERVRIIRSERGLERDQLLNELGRALAAVDFRKRQLSGSTHMCSYGPFIGQLEVSV